MKRLSKISKLIVLCLGSFFLWLVSIILPLIWPFLMDNNSCFKYLGCDSGFFGYDAIQHFLFGVAFLFGIIWFSKKFPKFSVVYGDKHWKVVLILISYITFIAVVWEIFECAHDYYCINILHENLFVYRLHVNHLAQPSNIDTMGDISFSMLGTIVALFSYWVVFKKKYNKISQ